MSPKFKANDRIAIGLMKGTVYGTMGEYYVIGWDGEEYTWENTQDYIDRNATLIQRTWPTDERDLSKPDYYVDGRKHEPFDVINDWQLSFALGNVVKYISRCGRKTADPIPDLEKARVYLDMEITRLKGLND